MTPVHMIGDKPFKLRLHREVRTRCGLVCAPVEWGATRYKMLSESGGDFLASTLKKAVTCRKCKNLISIGMIHVRRPLTARQLAAARANSKKSTGPRTAAGKARSSRNRTGKRKHIRG